MAEKYFNRREAEELLPLIGHSLKEALRIKKSADALHEDINRAATRIMVLGGSIPPYAELNRKKAAHDKAGSELREIIEKIQQTGCVVKDLEIGLVDFPSLRKGEEVYLCWKLGEARIAYYHGIEEGFAGRKPLDEPDAPENPPGSARIQ